MINGFSSFGDGVRPLRNSFRNDGAEWIAEIGFVGPPLDDHVRAIVHFEKVGSRRRLPSYYCMTLLEQPSACPLVLHRGGDGYTISSENLAMIRDWMSTPPRSVEFGSATADALHIDGAAAPDIPTVERVLSSPDGESRVRWLVDGELHPVAVDHRRRTPTRA